MTTKTCFLICPIGDEGSEIRKTADDLMDLIVIPALEKFDFEVVRADKIPSPSVITTDIIQLVQNAALCIIDLTGSNPNVFYECGRRHETGKPFIQLITKGERLPFDVSGIRTIPYDLSTARTTHATIKEIQNYVSELSPSDFSPGTGGESLSSLANAIQRIERKLDSVTIGVNNPGRATTQMEFLDKLRIEANPQKAFNEAYEAQELDKARSILPILHAKLGNNNEVLVAASLFAEAGDSGAVDLCVKILESPSEPIDKNILVNGISSLVGYYNLIDGQTNGIKVVEPIIQAQAKRDDLDDAGKASILNYLGNLLYATEQYKYALTISDKVIDLDPTQSVYFINRGLICDRLGMKTKAAEAMDSYMKMVGQSYSDLNNLSLIAAVYKKAGRPDDAKMLLTRMSGINPGLTERLINGDEELKSLMST